MHQRNSQISMGFHQKVVIDDSQISERISSQLSLLATIEETQPLYVCIFPLCAMLQLKQSNDK